MPKARNGIKVHISIRDGASKNMIYQEGTVIPRTDGLLSRIPMSLQVLVRYLKGGKQ